MQMTTRQAVVFIYQHGQEGVPSSRKPFQVVEEDLTRYFGGMAGFATALKEDSEGAIQEAHRIITEHVRGAKVRIGRDNPDRVDWNDHMTILLTIPQLERRAADLRFVEILAGF